MSRQVMVLLAGTPAAGAQLAATALSGVAVLAAGGGLWLHARRWRR